MVTCSFLSNEPTSSPIVLIRFRSSSVPGLADFLALNSGFLNVLIQLALIYRRKEPKVLVSQDFFLQRRLGLTFANRSFSDKMNGVGLGYIDSPYGGPCVTVCTISEQKFRGVLCCDLGAIGSLFSSVGSCPSPGFCSESSWIVWGNAVHCRTFAITLREGIWQPQKPRP